MGQLSFLELKTVYVGSHVKLDCFLKNGQDVTVGELSVYLFDDNFSDIKTATSNLDKIDRDTLNSFTLTFDGFIYDEFIKPFKQTPYSIWGRIALLESLYIYPEHRKSGYGKQVLKMLSRTLKDVYLVDFVVLKPYPLFASGDESIIEEVPIKRVIAEHIKKLVSFYESFGFKTQRVNKQHYQCLCLSGNILE